MQSPLNSIRVAETLLACDDPSAFDSELERMAASASDETAQSAGERLELELARVALELDALPALDFARLVDTKPGLQHLAEAAAQVTCRFLSFPFARTDRYMFRAFKFDVM